MPSRIVIWAPIWAFFVFYGRPLALQVDGDGSKCYGVYDMRKIGAPEHYGKSQRSPHKMPKTEMTYVIFPHLPRGVFMFVFSESHLKQVIIEIALYVCTFLGSYWLF